MLEEITTTLRFKLRNLKQEAKLDSFLMSSDVATVTESFLIDMYFLTNCIHTQVQFLKAGKQCEICFVGLFQLKGTYN